MTVLCMKPADWSERRSTLRTIDMSSWKIIKKINLPTEVFGEGLTVMNGKIYVLTWRDKRCLIYNQKSLQLLGEMSYIGEGWGLTDNGESLIMTNGSHIISFVSPDDFRLRRTIAVYDLIVRWKTSMKRNISTAKSGQMSIKQIISSELTRKQEQSKGGLICAGCCPAPTSRPAQKY